MFLFNYPNIKVLIILVLLVALAGVAIAYSSTSANEPGEVASQGSVDSVLTATPEFPPTWPPTPEDWAGLMTPLEGVPAIQPSVASASPDGAAVTTADISAYVATWDAGTTIESIEFVSGAEIEQRMAMLPGELGDRLVVIVTLHGKFSFTRPPEASSLPPTVSRMAVLFDAHTGNELMHWFP